VEERWKNQVWDNYWFNLLARASHFRSVSKTVSIPWRLIHRCDWRLWRGRCGMFVVPQKFARWIIGCVRLLSGRIGNFLLSLILWAVKLFNCYGSLGSAPTCWILNWWYAGCFGQNMSLSCRLSIVILMIPHFLLMLVLTYFRKGFPRMIEIFYRGSMLMTMKSTKIDESRTSIRTSLSIP
jgi:hypothetical protein